MTFFIKHKVIYPHQFGFQSKISTSHAMLDLVTAAYDNIDLYLHTGLVLIDLKKAFDTICHKILLNKLAHYGIWGVAFKLLSSYLTYQKQFVNFNQHHSELKDIKYGVPQGSSLGPLLFLIYVNDLQNAVDCTPRLFADDTCFIFQASNPLILQGIINKELKNLNIWCCANKLTVNPSKSNVLVISPKLIHDFTEQLTVSYDTFQICSVKSVKYLGVIIDNRINFYEHIKVLECKIARSVGILTKLKTILPKQNLLQLYYTLVHSHLTYGIFIWGSTYPSHLQKLQKLQNKALKAICNAPYRSLAKPLYAQLNILQIEDVYKYEIAKFMFNFNKTLAPSPFSNFFQKIHQVSNRSTRLSAEQDNLYIPRYRNNRLQRCIKYQGVKIWNIIPKEIKKSTYNIFKNKYKKYLLSLY